MVGLAAIDPATGEMEFSNAGHNPPVIAREGPSTVVLVITDSIQATEAVRLARNIRQTTIAPLMAEAILRISEERSVSSLFD